MLKRAISGIALLVALGSTAWAAIQDLDAPPSEPALNRAWPMINDPLIGTHIRGKAPAPPAIGVPDPDAQAALQDDARYKPARQRASPMINDPLVGTHIHGKPPASAKDGRN